MTLFEVIVHLILWPFNAAVYTYSALALVTGSEPAIHVVAAAGVMIALLLGSALMLRRRSQGRPRELSSPVPAKPRPDVWMGGAGG